MSISDSDTAAGGLVSPRGLASLSSREAEVLQKIATGQTNREVAGDLNVSVHAVKFHLASIYRKLEVTNRTEAVVVLLREGAS